MSWLFLILMVQLFGYSEIVDCSVHDGFLVWGNTMTLGVEHREFQCYLGRFE